MTTNRAMWRAFSGNEYDILNPVPEQLNLPDIAHHLSGQPRWNGAPRPLYSIAEHSIRVAELLPIGLKPSGLLHDGPEFILGDVSSPLKAFLPSYRMLEAEWSLAFSRRWGTFVDYNVFEADRLLRIYESHILFPNWESHIPNRREAWDAFYERWDTHPGADMTTTFIRAFEKFSGGSIV